MAHRRAGGFIDRGDGKGWVLDDTPAPEPPEPRPREAPKSPIQQAGGWALPTDVPAPEPVAESEPPEPEEDEPSNAEVRAWAKEQGIDVADRGKIPADVLEQYLNREK